MGSYLLWVAVAAGVIIAAELAIRAAAPRIAHLLVWRDWECQHKVAAIESLAARGGASVVCIGSSPMNSAFDAQHFTELARLGRPAFNASLNAATIRTLEPWTREVLLPKLHPELLILGLNSSEVNDNNIVGERGFKMFQSSLGVRRLRRSTATIGQRLILWLEERSFLVRYRHFLREPGSWGMKIPPSVRLRRLMKDAKGPFRRNRGETMSVTPFGMLHALAYFEGVPYQLTDRVIKTWKQIVVDYEVGGHELAALRRLVESTRSAGTAVLIVLMPVTQDWIDVHADGRSDFDRFKRALDDFVEESGVAFVDLMPLLTERSDYADAVHRNSGGRKHYTEALHGFTTDLMAASGTARGET